MEKEFQGKHHELARQIIQSFYKVYFNLGYGFLEKVYENSMVIELSRLGLNCVEQFPIKVYYEGAIVGDYFADIIVNDLVLVELKTAENIIDAHSSQLMNYLKPTKYEVGLLFNFVPKPKFIRRVLDNEKKGSMDWLGKDTVKANKREYFFRVLPLIPGHPC